MREDEPVSDEDASRPLYFTPILFNQAICKMMTLVSRILSAPFLSAPQLPILLGYKFMYICVHNIYIHISLVKKKERNREREKSKNPRVPMK